MIAGHFGFAALVKGREPETPLWALMFATVWLDIVFIPLFMTGLEGIQSAEPGHTGYGANIIHADYTHSIVGVVVLSLLLGIPAAFRWGRRAGMVIGLVAASHWALDLIVHRADLPLLPGNAADLPRLGFGLWRVPNASIALEAALILLGAWVYWRSARSVATRAGRGERAAAMASALIVLFGALVLGLDATGFAG